MGNVIHKVKFLIGVEDQVQSLKDELQSILNDAARMQGNSELTRQWIRDVREVALDAEDAIEIFTLKVHTPIPFHILDRNEVGKMIESIKYRLQGLQERRVNYGISNLGEVGTVSSLEIIERRHRMAILFQKDKDVVGLNEDANLLLQNVILNEKKGLSLAAIVGMGGIGKSTLARKIYNHPDVAARFEKRAWVVVSSAFAEEDIMMGIMYQLSDPPTNDELNNLKSTLERKRAIVELQQMLRKRLEGKHYFIVLDDLWEKTHWESLKSAFPNEQDKANKLLFTSRNQIITEHVHKMKHLEQDEGWELLLKTAFSGRSKERCPRKLEEIGGEILKNCHGLPLAIKVAGGLLVNQEESKSGWGSVLKQMEKYHMETDVLKILELSYQNLPSHLKSCFLCLAFFKEDEVIQVRRLVQTWVALGLVQAGEGGVEKTARDYLAELINRCLIQVKSMSMDYRVKYCNVHDHLHELSMRKATEEIGFKSLRNENEQGSSSSYKLRHCVVRGSAERLMGIDSSNQGKYLRSLFLQVNDVHFTTSSYWKNFKLLRILDIEGSLFSELPSKVRGLIGIRLLKLRQKKGRLMLPSWLDRLINLEVLDIDCHGVEFPDVTWKMDNLRHFYIKSLDCNKFSDSMMKSSWKNLETLKYMRANNVLRGFSSRLRKLGIRMEEVDGGEAEFERFLVESQVQELHLSTRLFDANSYLPIPTSPYLTKLKLDGFKFFRSDMIQELGKLPELLFLKLDGALESTMSTMKVSCEGFHKLKVLHLSNETFLKNIEIEEGGMPRLQRLEIDQCPALQNIHNLSERIASGVTIIMWGYPNLLPMLCR